ncbi:hypothetical protein DYB35_013316 [Aphanomyces astaci]|uniref:HTH CENPB-type domain-containing protein n=1 Tax=Aphanomyces astaci TaxID=112090 RepID=A0A418DY66_APHAT|nr:hypothetical protein DYB35_013316 [Aphanomyces astaci]
MKLYSRDQFAAALDQALDSENGQSVNSIANDAKIPQTTLKEAVRRARSGDEMKQRGRKLALTVDMESDLREWALAMQARRMPVTADELIEGATKIIDGFTPGATLTRGWYDGFMKRSHDLTHRKSQSISNARNFVTDDDVDALYAKIKAAIVLVGNDAARVYNMDETGFAPKRHANKVIAQVGSTNVRSQEARLNFHMTIVGCIGANGTVSPPLFVLPGASVLADAFEVLTVEHAALASTSSGFMNSGLFLAWLKMFSKATGDVTKPVLLVYDGCASHYSVDIVDQAQKLGITLFLLPPNSTHLFQPLDVGVFRPLKRNIRAETRQFVWTNPSRTISKGDAIELACKTWAVSMRSDLCVRAFAATGIFPPNLETMLRDSVLSNVAG